jgi:CheY-like chemotaxis protein
MQKKILVIDDDLDTVEVITLVLEEYDYEIISSVSSTILKEISSIMPDLILLDHWLNGTAGSELCEAVKGDHQTAHIPIILISAAMGIEAVALKYGADAYISKPFDIDYLCEVVASTLISHA